MEEHELESGGTCARFRLQIRGGTESTALIFLTHDAAVTIKHALSS